MSAMDMVTDRHAEGIEPAALAIAAPAAHRSRRWLWLLAIPVASFGALLVLWNQRELTAVEARADFGPLGIGIEDGEPMLPVLIHANLPTSARTWSSRYRHVNGLFAIESKLTDADLSQCARLTQLHRLHLERTAITDEGLRSVSGLIELRRLSLAGTHITDAGLVHLSGLSQLVTLDLSETEITDAGLAHLSGLSNLGELRICNTFVTPVGVAEFEKSHPYCKVQRRR